MFFSDVLFGGGGEEFGASVRKRDVVDGVSVGREFQVVRQIVLQVEFIDLAPVKEVVSYELGFQV